LLFLFSFLLDLIINLFLPKKYWLRKDNKILRSSKLLIISFAFVPKQNPNKYFCQNLDLQ